MNRYRPLFYRRVRLFCELPIHVVARVTGLSAYRVAAIETGRSKPNEAERGALERFLQDRLSLVLAEDGPVPDWLRKPSKVLEVRQ
jgi:hypothetical protein